VDNIILSDEAYKWENGPLLLLAGPGTGKTYQLAMRIKHLTGEISVSPEEITIITFTTEAAKGMRMKIKEEGGHEYVDPSLRPKRIYTMHSLGYQIVLENSGKLGIKKDFIVVENDKDRKILMRDAAILLGYSEKDAYSAFEDRTTANNSLSEKSEKIIQKYEEILRSCNAIDYDDQISLACKILREDENIRKKHAVNSKYLLVDEYQDINQGQFELIELLSKDHREGLFVVGDDDQSIYSFRGGSPKFIRNFKDTFGEKAVVIQMQTSRRCPEYVMECASGIVSKFDPGRLPKGNYVYSKSNKGEVVLHNSPSDDREAEIISTIIKADIDSLKPCETCKQIPKRNYFILVRNKNYARIVQRKLSEYGIPFDSKFEDKNEGLSKFELVKNWLNNQNSNLLTRLCMESILEGGSINFPTSKSKTEEKLNIRKKGLEEISGLWNSISDGKSLLVVLQEKSSSSNLLKAISDGLSELIRSYVSGSMPNFLKEVVLSLKPWSSISKFFEEIGSLHLASKSDSSSKVRILTMQAAKGLQAHIVFIIGLEEEVIPRGGLNVDELSEEARLLFVGMTRAEEQLHLFRSRKRTGANTYKLPNTLKDSQFLGCLPEGKYKKQFHPAVH